MLRFLPAGLLKWKVERFFMFTPRKLGEMIEFDYNICTWKNSCCHLGILYGLNFRNVCPKPCRYLWPEPSSILVRTFRHLGQSLLEPSSRTFLILVWNQPTLPEPAGNFGWWCFMQMNLANDDALLGGTFLHCNWHLAIGCGSKPCCQTICGYHWGTVLDTQLSLGNGMV